MKNKPLTTEELTRVAMTPELARHLPSTPYSRKGHPCGGWEPAQEPEEPTTVCYHCGWLKSEHRQAMTPEHEAFVNWLGKTAPMTSAALKSHWEKGERYYVDSRVDLKGRRREFNRLNNMMREE